MGHLSRPPRPCALRHRAPASHACLAEGHGLVRLCSHHAGQHARLRGHQVVTLARAGELAGEERRRRGRKDEP
jgi:hypothetical protein